ncbi:MAG: hypothetical protein SFZ24_00565 [Planctomycetota bacterium]|nr:hypothetical protein [Planctomycetota bacterium]
MKNLIVSAAVLVCASHSLAGNVWINSSKVSNYTETGSVGQAKFRLSHTNFDMTVDRGQGTNAGQFIQANLGNNTALNNVTFNFTLQHIAGQGLIFTMVNTKNTVTNADDATSVLSWGSFVSPPAGTTAVAIGGENAPGPSNPNAARQSFNTLRLDAQANRTQPPGSSMAFSNLVFTSGLTVADGSFYSGSVVTPSGGPADANEVQYLVSDMNLGAFDWTLTGSLVGYRDTLAGGDEQVRFVVGLKQSNFNIVPMPTPMAMAGAGLLAVAGLTRRRMGR